MARAITVRFLVITAVLFGLSLGWSSGYPPVDLDAWRAHQAAEAAEAAEELPNNAAVLQEQTVTEEPVATPTPIPPPGAAGSTPTPTPTYDGEMAVDCVAVFPGVHTNCGYGATDEFTIQIHVPSPPAGGYFGFELILDWDDPVVYLPGSTASESLWPDCDIPARAEGALDTTSLAFGCVPFSELVEGSTFTGAILQFDMQCTADGTTDLLLTPRDADVTGSYFLDEGGRPLVPALAAATVTCGSGGRSAPEPPGQSPTPSLTPTPTPTSEPTPLPPDSIALPDTVDEKEITTEGGRIDSRDGRVSIELPPEAVSERLKVRITHKDIKELSPIPGHPFMTAWEFEAFAVDRRMAKVERFPEDMKITVNYTEQDLLGRNPDTLKLWTWNERTEEWEALPSEHVPNSGTVVVEVDHFSLDVGTSDPAVVSPGFLRAFQTDLHTGASEVTVPIEVPPGRGGLTPNLTLSYSSNSVNEMKARIAQGSWVGIGWDLSVGSIRKVFGEYPGETSRYFLELNGHGDELILGQDGEWYGKHHEYLRIDEMDSCDLVEAGDGIQHPVPPCHWIVTDKQGTKYYFGGTESGADAEAARYYDYYWEAPGEYELYYYRWDLRKVVDTHGNSIFYGYDQQILDDWPQGAPCCQPWVFSSYPTEILYNANRVKIDFELGWDYQYSGFPPMNLRNDSPHNVDGCDPLTPKAEETRRLDAIDVQVKSGSTFQLVRSYEFDYDTTDFTAPDCEPTSGKHELNWMRQLGNDGSSELYRMVFSYQTKHFGFHGEYQGQDWEYPGFGFDRIFLTNATNGFGGSAAYQYQEMWIDPRDSGHQTWTREIVTRRTLYPHVTGVWNMITDYSYDDGPTYYAEGPSIADYARADYRGFGQVTETRETGSFGTYTVHQFYTTTIGGDEEPRTGREIRTEIYQEGGTTPWRTVLNDWQAATIAGCNCEARFVKLARVTTFDGYSDAASLLAEYDYDAYGNVIWERQLGEVVPGDDDRTIHRPHHANTNQWIFLPQMELVYEGNYSASNSPPSVALRSATGFYYDYGDHVYDTPTDGLLTAIERSDGGNPPALHSTAYFAYDNYGNRTAESVPTGIRAHGSMPGSVARTTWVYDTVLRAYPVSITNPVGHVTTLQWDLRMGTVDWRVEPTGHTVHFDYDEFGRLVKTWDEGFTTEDAPSTEHHYFWDQWETGYINSTWTLHRYGGASGDVTWESHCVDGFGREVQVRRSYTSSQDSVVQRTYDRRGLVAYIFEPWTLQRADWGWCDSLTGTGGRPRTEFVYNPLDEAGIVRTIANGQTTTRTVDHNGLTTTVTDENAHRVEYRSDGLGRTDCVTEYTGTDPYAAYAITRYGYDVLDNLRFVYDGAGEIQPDGCESSSPLVNVTEMRYDPLGRKTEMFDPDMGHWTYEYDEAGNLRQQTDARGQSVWMEYDDLNRLTKKCYTANCNNPEAAFTYDSYPDGSFCSGSQAKGQLTRVDTLPGEPGSITDDFCHDQRGRVTKERREIEGSQYAIWRTYDKADRPVSVTYPDGEVVSYDYDSNPSNESGLPDDLSSPLSHYVWDATYDAAFRIDTLRLGTSYRTNYLYDQLGRPKDIKTPRPGGDYVQNLVFETYDNVGNVTRLRDYTANYAINMEYDHLDRLVGVTGSYNTTYEYDQIGNITRIQEGETDWYLSYDPGRKPHAALIVDGEWPGTADSIIRAYDYDANGNLIDVAEGDDAKSVDSDHDGCSNENERGEVSDDCGLRDPGDFWDYFNPTRDCLNRVDDILAVVASYFKDGNPWEQDVLFSPTPPDLSSYHPLRDRGIHMGQDPLIDPWKLAPANGEIRVTDIMASVHQYFHDNPGGCAPDFPDPDQYEYDEENRLVRQGDTTYTYDGQGALAKKTEDGETTIYVADVYEKNLSTGQITKYYWFNGRRVAMRHPGSTAQYLLTDHLGSTTTVLDDQGYIVSQQRYYPFGRTRTGGVDTDKQFTGHQAEGDLYYMQARFYDPQIGRFLQPDTIVPDPMNPQSLNRYSYVLNNPLRYTDPTGRTGYDPNYPELTCFMGMACQRPVPYDPIPVALPGCCPVPLGTTAEEYSCMVYGDCGDGWGPSWAQPILKAASIVAGFLPFSGQWCAGQEALHGTECITLRELDTRERAISSVGLIPLGKLAKCLKGLRTLRFADEALEHHHLLPLAEEFQEHWARAELNPKDFVVIMPAKYHRYKPLGLHTGSDNWNAQWRRFFQRNPNAGREKILEQLDRMIEQSPFLIPRPR